MTQSCGMSCPSEIYGRFPSYDRDSALDLVVGAYSGFELGSEPASFVVEPGGALFGQTRSGCVMNGQVGVIDITTNAYDLSVSLSDCVGLDGDYDGLGRLGDSSPSGSLLTFLVFSNSATVASSPTRIDRLATAYTLDTGILTTCVVDESGGQCWGASPVDSIPPLTDVRNFRTASQNATCALDANGVTCWGTQDIVSVPPLQDPYAIDQHNEIACALDSTGVVCWGNGAANILPTPTLSTPSDIALSYGGGSWACALDDSGVVCWGDSTSGQLNVPARSNPSQIAVGESHACALDDTGVVCWGRNGTGEADDRWLLFSY